MRYEERQAMNGLLANQFYKNAVEVNRNITASDGTPMGIDGATGRTFVIAGDGVVRTKDIASSSQLGITSPFARGANGNAGYNDGRSA